MAAQPKSRARREAAFAELTGKAGGKTPKAAGKDYKEQREQALQLLSENPIWQAYEQRKAARLARLKAEGSEWIKAKDINYTDEQCLSAIELVPQGHNLLEACEMLDLSYPAVFKRVQRNPDLQAAVDAARELYAHERVKQAQRIAEEEADPARARILTDLIKWEVSKVLPKFYGDKVNVDAGDSVTFQLNIGKSST